MATIKQLQEKIAKLEKGISSKATSSNAKVKMRTQVKNFQTDISDIIVKRLQAKAKAKPTSSKVSKAKEISKEMKRKYNKSRPSGGSNIIQDAERPAKPIGRRTSAQGKTYYEYRENRTDRKQPPKRYPRLEDGGTTGAGNIKINDTVMVEYANDHNSEKYSIGDTFIVKHISGVGSDNSYYISGNDIKYKLIFI